MKQRLVALMIAATLTLLSAVSALAAPPSDDPAQGCENQRAKPIAGYCETNP